MLVWLSSHAHFQRKETCTPAHDQLIDGPSATRPRCRLSRKPWFLNRLAGHHVECEWTVSRSVLNEDTTLLGVFRVQPLVAWDGPLTRWDVEAELLWEYFGRHSDSFAARILDGVWLDSPLETLCAVGRQGSVSIAPCTHPFWPFVGDPAGLAGRACCNLQGVAQGQLSQVLNRWGVDVRADGWQLLPVLSMPRPIVELIRVRAWAWLVFRTGSVGWSQCVTPLLTPAFLAQIRPHRIESLDLDFNLTPAFLDDHVAYLRQWAPIIIAQADHESRDILEGQVRALDGLSAILKGDQRPSSFSRGSFYDVLYQ